MFTGLVRDIGRVAAARAAAGGMRIAIRHALPGGPLARGESVAVDGCCLTALAVAPGRFEADLSPETLARTGGPDRWRTGRRVNLERAARLGDRLGGHIVQGHLDGLVRLLSRRDLPDGSAVIRVELPAEAAHLVCEKGSVALDGVSLTVARLGTGWFEVALIPETLAATTLGERRAGDRLGVEFDVLAKYAERALSALRPAARRGRGPR
ncbi:MAG: riboflavin synthase [Acidobacteria bacterium]|nr:MAG: riboflavin synthase [Acidobacteriota bacterium]